MSAKTSFCEIILQNIFEWTWIPRNFLITSNIWNTLIWVQSIALQLSIELFWKNRTLSNICLIFRKQLNSIFSFEGNTYFDITKEIKLLWLSQIATIKSTT